MKDKTPQEQIAASRQVELLTQALEGASQDGHWLNVSGRMMPRIYGKNAAISPFNALIFTLHADARGYPTSIYTSFQDARKQGDAVLKSEKAVPMNWYRWNTYVNRADEKDVIDREQYLALTPEQQTSYKAVRQREIRSLFNLEQTTFPHSDAKGYEQLKQQYGGMTDRGNLAAEERQARTLVNTFKDVVSQNLVPVRRSATADASYDAAKDAVYMPSVGSYPEYRDYVQELMRQTVAATGHPQRLSREGLAMPEGKTPSAAAMRHESLIRELASGMKMVELGLPAKLSPEAMGMVEQWCTDLKENPCMIDAIESDLNNAMEMIHKAEQGEKIEMASARTGRQTQEARDVNRPQVSHEEALVLQDILAHGGMQIDVRNFPGDENEAQAAKKAFMEKFTNLDYYEGQVLTARWNAEKYTKNPDPENPDLANVAYTVAASEASRIYEKCSEWLPKNYEQKGPHFIAEEMWRVPDKRNKEFVVVYDKETGIADVVMPSGARKGGDVVMPDGDRRNYWMTPDEVMLADERKEAGAKAVSHNLPGFSKEKISAALMAQGATYVRFFNVDGVLQYRPDDAYFKNKDVYAAKLNGKELNVTAHFDLADAVSRSTEKQFDRISMLKDDNGRWAMLLKPENEATFAIYPDKDDQNRFFSTIKNASMETSQAVRNELAQKYYAMATANPGLKFNIFGDVPEGIDPRQIERVNIFRSKEEKHMIIAQLAGGQKLAPRELTAEQWQRLWMADDVAQYKTALAANVFKDVLLQQSQKETVEQQHNEEKAIARPEVPVVQQTHLQQYSEMKKKHPDALLLFRHGDEYVTYKEDAVKAAEILGGKPKTVNGEDRTYSFAHAMLDTVLPKLVRGGERVAICEELEPARKNGEKVERSKPEPVVEENQHKGLRM